MQANEATFEDLKITRQFLNAIEDRGYKKPTPVQEKTIPLINGGHDVLGIAQTGTGKTAAFVLPILQKLKYAQGNIPRAIIIAPSKELVLQIEENVKAYSQYTDLRSLAIYGGVGPKGQVEKLNEGVDIVISTPARVMELYLRKALILKSIKTMVLDEADKLMDMGFMRQIRSILEVIPNKRQNLLFSATFPTKVENLSNEFLTFPKRIEVAPQATTASTITQYVYPTENFIAKVKLLGSLLENEKEYPKVIVFANTKKTADNIYKFVNRKISEQVRVVHSNKGQNARINSIEAFRTDEVRIMITTDVSARGIDVPNISHAINFDIPTVPEEYVHRVGRTGRAEKEGIAISFANKGEMLYLREIEKLIDKKVEVLSYPSDIKIEPTPKHEIIEIERVIDKYKRWKDPTFKGAFHDKKRVIAKRETRKKNHGHK